MLPNFAKKEKGINVTIHIEIRYRMSLPELDKTTSQKNHRLQKPLGDDPKKTQTTTIKYINTPNSSNANDIYSGQIKSNDTVVGTKDEETRFTPVSVILVDLF